VRRLVADAARAHDAQIWTASVLSCIDQMSAHSGGSARGYREPPVPLAIPLRPSMQRPGPYVYA
jgi:hypothetical protein